MKQSEIISAFLEKLERENGGITPALVVEAARPEESPIHSHFQWDDEKAADSYRLWQARQLIAKVYIHVDTDDSKTQTVKVRAFHSIAADEEDDEDENRQYVGIVRIMSDNRMKEQLLADAKRDMQFFKTKYKILKELAPIFAEMDKLIKD